jgi:hypothetical protein
MWTESAAQTMQNGLNLEDHNHIIKHSKVSLSSLGGADKSTMFLHLSADSKENWINGIYHNSRYAIFSLNCIGKLELISKGFNMPKFRKCSVKGSLHAAEKIVKYFQGV